LAIWHGPLSQIQHAWGWRGAAHATKTHKRLHAAKTVLAIAFLWQQSISELANIYVPAMTHISPRLSDEPRLSTHRADPPWRLPKRDYILLPAIFMLTILVLLLGGELTARLL
jgi:hypothetical protein